MSFRTVIPGLRWPIRSAMTNVIPGLTRNLLIVLLLAFASCTRADILTMFVGTYSDGFYAYDFDQNAG